VAGQGSPLGGELTRVGDSRTAVELTQSLRAPNAVEQPNQRSYALTTKAGVSVNGRLLNRDAYSVQLLDSEGRLRSFALEELATYGFAASPMPALGSDWSDREVADLVAYLASLRAPTQTGAAR
jgi:putative heme-binding domain-containing protein